MSAETPEKTTTFNRQQILSLLGKGFLTLFVTGLIVVILYFTGVNQLIEQLELKTYDIRAQLNGDNTKRKPSPDIVILEFDDPSLNALSDEFGLWPWPRSIHARMIRFLNSLQVRDIVYDLMFVGHRNGEAAQDQALIDEFAKSSNVYISLNLNNDLQSNQKVGKDLTPRQLKALRRLSIPIQSYLDAAPKSLPLRLEKDSAGHKFFQNNAMTFNYFRSILPGLLDVGHNISVINHGTDEDGVSRGNPLFFRLAYQPFMQSKALPYHQQQGKWYDADGKRIDADGYLFQHTKYGPITHLPSGYYVDHNPLGPRPVDAEGILLNAAGTPIYQRQVQTEYLNFPYLGLRIILDYEYPNQVKPALVITSDAHLRFKNHDIPLSYNGNFLVNWYNTNQSQNLFRGYYQKLSAKYKQLQQKNTHNQYAQELKEIKAQLEKIEIHLGKRLMPQPYPVVSAWEVIQAMRHYEKGQPYSPEEQQMMRQLKNKIIFVGATAVGTYDIKNTPIHATLPGVLLQATLFDNLYQNKHNEYIHRSSPTVDFLVVLVICILTGGLSFKMRSPLAGILTALNLGLSYLLIALVLFQTYGLWISVAMPIACLILTVTLTYVLKYFLRTQDYEKTYALATTDSMTGLYNHRFFQEHMRRSIDQSNRFKQQFSLVLIDIDFFKKFNDTYGHQAGDEVLRQVAKKLKKNVRTVDVVARYGGEEMAIILERTNEIESLTIAEKIVASIAEEAYPIAEGVAKHVTISCGVATYPNHGQNVSELIDFADAGLYRAKENGRNQVGAQYETPFLG